MIAADMGPDWKALDAIWKRVDPWASKDIDITVTADMIRDMVFKLADECDRLRAESLASSMEEPAPSPS